MRMCPMDEVERKKAGQVGVCSRFLCYMKFEKGKILVE